MKKWDVLADEQAINKTIASLKVNGIEAFVVENGKEAKKKTLELIPKGSQVMTVSSQTIDQIGLSQVIDESGEYRSTRKEIASFSESESRNASRRLNAAVEYVVGSVHAVTEDGKVLIASNTGSQLPAYSFAAEHVIWAVSTQKITKDLDGGMERLYEYVLKLESERLKKLYGVPSNVSKLLIINKEINPDRIKMVLIKEKLGF